jgi:hypothetical protein
VLALRVVRVRVCVCVCVVTHPLSSTLTLHLVQAPLYGLLTKGIELGSKAAIWLSTRI